LCPPKSGSDWGPNELDIQFQDAATFFGVNPLPQPAVANELLKRLDADDMTNGSNYKFVRYMDLAMDRVLAEDSAVLDFCRLSTNTVGSFAPNKDNTHAGGNPAYHLWRAIVIRKLVSML
jgi:hypothetical protein